MSEPGGPDERALRRHLEDARFLDGVAAGRWRVVSIDWPAVLVVVAAAARGESPSEYTLRLDLSGYPHQAPTGSLWSIADGCWLPAERRPRGERVALVFRTDGWAGGAAGMYAPWDRVAIGSHQWAGQYPQQEWNPSRDLTFVLSNVHELLNADDYEGA